MTDLSPLESRIKTEEGLRLYVYDDANGQAIKAGSTVRGNPTIGYGTNLVQGAGITETEAEYMLSSRIQWASQDAASLPCFNKLDDVRRLVLVDMCFNMGLPTLKTFTGFLGMLAAGNYAAAADDMLTTLWAKQVGKRATELANIIRTGVWQ